ncbi:MAG TPA: sugar ABC transporter permease, partial [Candidatus Acidoferrales bacterium]|nr:sugar ABC transporter permease [Candidatus Acidoferrales bacterium]
MDQLPTVAAIPRFRLRRSPRQPSARSSPLARREARQGLLFISPWIVGFLAFTLFPMVATLAFTFLNITLAQEEPLRFVGLDNYSRMLGDQHVWDSLAVTLKFAALWLPISIVVPFTIALGLNSKYVRGAGLIRTLFFVPYVVPFVAGVLVWEQMLGDAGWVNGVLKLVG